MVSMAVSAKGAESTAAVARLLAPHLRGGDAVMLTGGLATGKTTFVQAVAAALGSPSAVTSPTFTLAHFYPCQVAGDGPGTILHIDAYRLSGVHEYRDLGLADYAGESVTFAEWGEKIAEDFPCHLAIEFHCEASAPDVRLLTLGSGCDRWERVVTGLQSALLGQSRLA